MSKSYVKGRIGYKRKSCHHSKVFYWVPIQRKTMKKVIMDFDITPFVDEFLTSKDL
jgi:hypothetical protein